MSPADPGPWWYSVLLLSSIFLASCGFIVAMLLRRSLEVLFPFRIYAVLRRQQGEALPEWMGDPTMLKFGFRWLGELFLIILVLSGNAYLELHRMDWWWVPLSILVYFAAAFVLGQLAPALILRMTSEEGYRTLLTVIERAVRTIFPVIKPLHAVSVALSGQVTLGNGDETEADEAEVAAYLESGTQAGLIRAEEREMIRSVIDLDEMVVRQVMTPRTSMVTIPETATLDDILRCVAEHPKSRIPVFRGTVDRITGVFYVKDLVKAMGRKQPVSTVAGLMREAYYIPPDVKVPTLLSEFRLRRQHIAIVVDEYGGAIGLVTIEDLLEQIVGDINDEYDLSRELLVQPWGEGGWMANARLPVVELEELTGIHVESEDFDSLGGFVLHRLEHLPREGEHFIERGYVFTVLRVDDRRVQQVLIQPEEQHDPGQLTPILEPAPDETPATGTASEAP